MQKRRNTRRFLFLRFVKICEKKRDDSRRFCQLKMSKSLKREKLESKVDELSTLKRKKESKSPEKPLKRGLTGRERRGIIIKRSARGAREGGLRGAARTLKTIQREEKERQLILK